MKICIKDPARWPDLSYKKERDKIRYILQVFTLGYSFEMTDNTLSFWGIVW